MKQFTSVGGRYGAPMGRGHYCTQPTARVHVFRVRLVDHDYDDGGAYWGGAPSHPLYCVRDRRDDPDVQLFYRARTRADAIRQMRDEYPSLTPKRA